MSKSEKDEQKKVEKKDLKEESLKKLEKLKKEVDEQKDKFLRIVAEYDNYRKRTERDKIGIYNDAISDAINEILPIADSLDRASEVKDGSEESYKKGIELVKNQFSNSLKKLKVESFGEIGDKFDPEIHNAISHIEDDKLEENTIVEIFQLGYKIGDKIIRHAMVKVAN